MTGILTNGFRRSRPKKSVGRGDRSARTSTRVASLRVILRHRDSLSRLLVSMRTLRQQLTGQFIKRLAPIPLRRLNAGAEPKSNSNFPAERTSDFEQNGHSGAIGSRRMPDIAQVAAGKHRSNRTSGFLRWRSYSTAPFLASASTRAWRSPETPNSAAGPINPRSRAEIADGAIARPVATPAKRGSSRGRSLLSSGVTNKARAPAAHIMAIAPSTHDLYAPSQLTHLCR